MGSEHTDIGGRIARWWVGYVVRRARAVVAAMLALTLAAAVLVASTLDVNTDATDMLSADLPFRQNSIALEHAFPQLNDNLVVVIDGPSPDQVADAADVLRVELGKHEPLLGEVFDPSAAAVFRRNGFLYRDDKELDELLERLVTAQPFVGKLWSDPTLPGLFGTVELVLDESGGENGAIPGKTAGDLLTSLAAAIEAHAAGRASPFSWRRLFAGEAAEDKREFHAIVLQPKLDYASLAPGRIAIDKVREIIRTLDLERLFGVQVRLTGSVALRHEELQSLRNNMGLASVLSLVIVGGLLVWGLGSGVQVGALIGSLIVGLVLTAGWAALSVGELNLISVAFAILFIGLGADFGVHFCLRYREELGSSASPIERQSRAAADVGGALALSALTAAIGFLSFVPTDYRGLADLGIIAGGGMFIALMVNLTLLPALLSLWPGRTDSGGAPARRSAAWDLRRIAKPGAILVSVLTLACLFVFPQVRFDFDPMNLRNPKSESVKTVQDMMATGQSSVYSIDILASDAGAAEALAARLETLPSVDHAETLADYLPKNQPEKLAIIESAAFTLLPSLSTPPARTSASEAERLAALTSLRRALNRFGESNPAGELAPAVQHLLNAMSDFATRTRLAPETLASLERSLTAALPGRLRELKDALQPTSVALQDLPASLVARVVAADGRAKVEVFPKEDMRDRDKLRTFVEDVHSVAPNASGGPVTIVEAGDTVMRAFIEAGLWSIAAITLLTLVLLRSVRETLFIFTPLIMAAILTVGVSVLIDMPFNFANVIVLPLLFGLGIASGIHMVLRERSAVTALGVVDTSTPRAVFFSALTTVGSFGTVSLSQHPGTASMGVLLTIAIVLTLVCSLTVLPALLERWPIAKGGPAAGRELPPPG